MSREKLKAAGWYKENDDHVHWFHEKFDHEPMSYEEACRTLNIDVPEGMMDWNNQPMEFYVSVLDKWKYQSSGEAKAICELIRFYEANKDRDPNRTED